MRRAEPRLSAQNLLVSVFMESQERLLGKTSRRHYQIQIACICFFVCLSAHAGYITRWIGFGADSLWTNPTNWDRLAVPDSNSDVIITNTGGKHVVLNVDTRSHLINNVLVLLTVTYNVGGWT